jgi:hypothetical protein
VIWPVCPATGAPAVYACDVEELSGAELAEMIEEALGGTYDDEDEVLAIYDQLEEHLTLGFGTTVLGIRVSVESITFTNGTISAGCVRGEHRQEIALQDLPLPDPLPEGAEWILAYCYAMNRRALYARFDAYESASCSTLAAVTEIHYYEFLAVARPLSRAQQAEIREFAKDATITATELTVECENRELVAHPVYLMQHYYDAHLYTANFGSRRIMVKVPRTALGPQAAEQYCVPDRVSIATAGEHVILDLSSEELDVEEEEEDDEYTLEDIAAVRDEIAAGDLRPLYLAWLAAYGEWERYESAFDDEDEDVVEPPVPAGLDKLTDAQQALARFLRLDDDLLTVASRAAADDPSVLTASVKALPDAEKDRLLLAVANGQAEHIRRELLRRTDPPRRTVGELLDAAATLHQ